MFPRYVDLLNSDNEFSPRGCHANRRLFTLPLSHASSRETHQACYGSFGGGLWEGSPRWIYTGPVGVATERNVSRSESFAEVMIKWIRFTSLLFQLRCHEHLSSCFCACNVLQMYFSFNMLKNKKSSRRIYNFSARAE